MDHGAAPLAGHRAHRQPLTWDIAWGNCFRNESSGTGKTRTRCHGAFGNSHRCSLTPGKDRIWRNLFGRNADDGFPRKNRAIPGSSFDMHAIRRKPRLVALILVAGESRCRFISCTAADRFLTIMHRLGLPGAAGICLRLEEGVWRWWRGLQWIRP